MTTGDVEILVSIGDAEPRVAALTLDKPDEVIVTIVFSLESANVSLSFDAQPFLAFVGQLQRFAATMPGRPS